MCRLSDVPLKYCSPLRLYVKEKGWREPLTSRFHLLCFTLPQHYFILLKLLAAHRCQT